MAQERELTLVDKADKVAEATIQANARLNTAAGRDHLKGTLSKKLVERHKQGKLDIDKFIEKTHIRERKMERDEGRNR